MRRVWLSRSTASAVAAAFVLSAFASPAHAATNTQIDFAVCPNIRSVSSCTFQGARTAKPGTFAVLLTNSVAGQGAGEFVWTKTTRSSAELKGAEYYACGTIKVEATLRYQNRSAAGTARLNGKGVLAGGTDNYDGIRGAFAVTGTYSAKTGRRRLVLRGTATY